MVEKLVFEEKFKQMKIRKLKKRTPIENANDNNNMNFKTWLLDPAKYVAQNPKIILKKIDDATLETNLGKELNLLLLKPKTVKKSKINKSSIKTNKVVSKDVEKHSNLPITTTTTAATQQQQQPQQQQQLGSLIQNSGPVGITNSGTDCFINSIIQSLKNIDQFPEYIFQKSSLTDYCAIKEFVIVLRGLCIEKKIQSVKKFRVSYQFYFKYFTNVLSEKKKKWKKSRRNFYTRYKLS